MTQPVHVAFFPWPLLLMIPLWALPSIIAWRRHSRSTRGVVVLNVLLGWLPLVWVAVLVWALLSQPRALWVDEP